MTAHKLPVGSYVRLDKPALQAVMDRLIQLGFRTIGPRLRDGAVLLDDVERLDQFPRGVRDCQDGGKYRLEASDENAYFDYVVGPNSVKSFLFPAYQTILEGECVDGKWQFRTPDLPDQPLAIIGVRACDIQAIRLQDQVFQAGETADRTYQHHRQNLFLLAINCRCAADTCFCHSMRTGPTLSSGYDLGLTELDDCFVIEIGTERGGNAVSDVAWEPCSLELVRCAEQQSQQLLRSMQKRSQNTAGQTETRGRHLNTEGIRELLNENFEHPHWQDVQRRCLACGNCTMVCPTCFCSDVDDVTDLTGLSVRRERTWASCFSESHSLMNSGPVRYSTSSRYRQWLTHKLAFWWDQFDMSGCVGCGRCITWCPVGIDLTVEVAAIRGDQP